MLGELALEFHTQHGLADLLVVDLNGLLDIRVARTLRCLVHVIQTDPRSRLEATSCKT